MATKSRSSSTPALAQAVLPPAALQALLRPSRGIVDLKDDPPVLVVAPLSGHHSTLLRDTVQNPAAATTRSTSPTGSTRAWCRRPPAPSTLDDYVATCRTSFAISAPRLHVISVCQPTVPVLAAVSLMAARGEPLPRA
jgi:poly(3-hydroxybutyrate) depolymerase